VIFHIALGERSAELLGRLKTWMARWSAVIMTVILVAIAAKLIGDAIAGFSS
jgi:hypothetical protein